MKFSPERARQVDLIILPANLPGTSCASCVHFDSSRKYCNHKKVRMNVSKRMCCYYWQNSRAPRATEKDLPMKLDKNSAKFRVAVRLRNRLGRELNISRFSDCGHDDDGDFGKGNTCGSLRGKKTSKPKVKKSIKEFSHEEREDLKKKILEHFAANSSGQFAGMIEYARKDLGYSKYFDPRNPMDNPVNFLTKELDDEGKIEVRRTAMGSMRFFVKENSKFSRSRFSDCGHNSDGSFSDGNTCGRLRGKKHESRMSSEDAHKIINHAYENFKDLSYEQINHEIQKLSDASTSELKSIYEKFMGSAAPYYNSTKGKMIAAIRDRIHRRKHTHTRTSF